MSNVAVEVFDALDVGEATNIEVTQEAMKIIEKLGLDGQKELMPSKNGTDTVQRLPFRKMTALEAWVYQVLCPEQTRLDRYSEEPIPFRVLERAAFAADSGLFKGRYSDTVELYVWHQAGAVKDPVLVAYGEGQYSFTRSDCFILARWGAELDELSTLAIKAREVFQKRYAAEIAKLQDRLEGLKNRALSGLMTDSELGLDDGQIPRLPDIKA